MLKVKFKERLKTLSYTYAAVTFGLVASLVLYSLHLFSLNFWLTAIVAYAVVTIFDLFVLSVISNEDITPSNFLFRVMILVVGMQTAFGGIYYFAANDFTYLARDGVPVKNFVDCMYFSGVTLLTVGYGDIVPVGDFRFTAVAEVYGGTLFIFAFFTWGLSIIANRKIQNRIYDK